MPTEVWPLSSYFWWLACSSSHTWQLTWPRTVCAKGLGLKRVVNFGEKGLITNLQNERGFSCWRWYSRWMGQFFCLQQLFVSSQNLLEALKYKKNVLTVGKKIHLLTSKQEQHGRHVTYLQEMRGSGDGVMEAGQGVVVKAGCSFHSDGPQKLVQGHLIWFTFKANLESGEVANIFFVNILSMIHWLYLFSLVCVSSRSKIDEACFECCFLLVSCHHQFEYANGRRDSSQRTSAVFVVFQHLFGWWFC